MTMLFNASGLVFSGPVNSTPNSVAHATGTYLWDPVANVGIWNISARLFYNGGFNSVNVGSWLDGSYPMTFQFSPSAFQASSPVNNGTVNGDISMSFSPSLADTTILVNGTYSLQDDFAPYTATGVISGTLTSVSMPIPEPSSVALLLVGLVTGAVFVKFTDYLQMRKLHRGTYHQSLLDA